METAFFRLRRCKKKGGSTIARSDIVLFLTEQKVNAKVARKKDRDRPESRSSKRETVKRSLSPLSLLFSLLFLAVVRPLNWLRSPKTKRE